MRANKQSDDDGLDFTESFYKPRPVKIRNCLEGIYKMIVKQRGSDFFFLRNCVLCGVPSAFIFRVQA